MTCVILGGTTPRLCRGRDVSWAAHGPALHLADDGDCVRFDPHLGGNAGQRESVQMCRMINNNKLDSVGCGALDAETSLWRGAAGSSPIFASGHAFSH